MLEISLLNRHRALRTPMEQVSVVSKSLLNPYTGHSWLCMTRFPVCWERWTLLLLGILYWQQGSPGKQERALTLACGPRLPEPDKDILGGKSPAACPSALFKSMNWDPNYWGSGKS